MRSFYQYEGRRHCWDLALRWKNDARCRKSILLNVASVEIGTSRTVPLYPPRGRGNRGKQQNLTNTLTATSLPASLWLCVRKARTTCKLREPTGCKELVLFSSDLRLYDAYATVPPAQRISGRNAAQHH
jgi:hypothetical protein